MKIKTNLLLAFGFSLSAISFLGCNSKSANANGLNRQSCIDSIKTIEAKLRTTQIPNTSVYNHAIAAYTRFANNFPNDTLAPLCLYDAANIYMSLTQYKQAICYYDTVSTKYPTFKRIADCYFIRGFIYDDKLKDTAKARAMYQAVIDKYPHDSIASQARAAISILGKSYDEIIKQFEEKNKNQKKA